MLGCITRSPSAVRPNQIYTGCSGCGLGSRSRGGLRRAGGNCSVRAVCTSPAASVAPLVELADAVEPSSVVAGIPALGVAVLPFAALLGFRFSLYSQLEVIRAQAIGNLVPRDSRSVVQLGGTTRDVFYYPNTTRQLTVFSADTAAGLFEQAGTRAVIPTIAYKRSPSSLDSLPDDSVDALVCLRGIATTEPRLRKRVIQESSRVLKPGAPFIFFETLQEGASPLRPLLTGDGKQALETSLLEDILDDPGLEVLQVDVALQGTNPHAVGVARCCRSRDPDEDLEKRLSRKKTRIERRQSGFGQ